jgi:hypothetical protein
VHAGLRARDRDRGVAAGGEHEDRVDVGLQQVLPACERPRRAEAPGARSGDGRRHVAQRRDLEAIVELGQIGEMHDLRDQPAAHDAHFRSIRHPRSLRQSVERSTTLEVGKERCQAGAPGALTVARNRRWGTPVAAP